MKKIALIFGIIILLQALSPLSVHAQGLRQVKELNFVFLHGASGHADSLQALSDSLQNQIRDYVTTYEHDNPNIDVQVNILLRGYPNDVDIETWADNAVDAIDKYFTGKKDLILVGHSMGGKTALYAVAHNIKGLADKVSTVVTINSPVIALRGYFAAGSAAVYDYCRAGYFLSDHGVCDSVTNYDSTEDGTWVAQHKHWLALISSESAPSDPRFDRNGVDPAPRDLDDGVVPLSAQYIDTADIVYYGIHGHSEFDEVPDVTQAVAGYILKYIFGGTVECSVRGPSGNFTHTAGWMPVKYYWTDTFGEILASQGFISHFNAALFNQQVWEDTVGSITPGNIRSSFRTHLLSLPFFTGIVKTDWAESGTNTNGSLLIKSKAWPKTTVRANWEIFQTQLLSAGMARDHYEIKIDSSTPQAVIPTASWTIPDVRDIRITVNSDAMGPFKWYQAHWQIFTKQARIRNVISEINTLP